MSIYSNRLLQDMITALEAVITAVTAMASTAAVNTWSLLQTFSAGIAVTGTAVATGAVTAMSATAVPAGGTAGAGFKFSSVSNLGVFFGSGAPTLAAAQGSLYVRTDGSSSSTRIYVNSTGSTTWVAVTTAS